MASYRTDLPFFEDVEKYLDYVLELGERYNMKPIEKELLLELATNMTNEGVFTTRRRSLSVKLMRRRMMLSKSVDLFQFLKSNNDRGVSRHDFK